MYVIVCVCRRAREHRSLRQAYWLPTAAAGALHPYCISLFLSVSVSVSLSVNVSLSVSVSVSVNVSLAVFVSVTVMMWSDHTMSLYSLHLTSPPFTTLALIVLSWGGGRVTV